MHKFTRASLLDLIDDLHEENEIQIERKRCKRAMLRLSAEHKTSRGETDDLIGNDISESLIIEDEIIELNFQLQKKPVKINLIKRILNFFDNNNNINFASLRASSVLQQFLTRLTNVFNDNINDFDFTICIINIFKRALKDQANLRYIDVDKILQILDKIDNDNEFKEKLEDFKFDLKSFQIEK